MPKPILYTFSPAENRMVANDTPSPDTQIYVRDFMLNTYYPVSEFSEKGWHTDDLLCAWSGKHKYWRPHVLGEAEMKYCNIDTHPEPEKQESSLPQLFVYDPDHPEGMRPLQPDDGHVLRYVYHLGAKIYYPIYSVDPEWVWIDEKERAWNPTGAQWFGLGSGRGLGRRCRTSLLATTDNPKKEVMMDPDAPQGCPDNGGSAQASFEKKLAEDEEPKIALLVPYKTLVEAVKGAFDCQASEGFITFTQAKFLGKQIEEALAFCETHDIR